MGTSGQPLSPARAQANTPGQQALQDLVRKHHDLLSRGRFSEENEWFQSGLFHQLRQWLEIDPATNRLRPRRQDANKPAPMPVSNHFSVTINLNANALGADVPGMRAWADNYDARNRRAADAAENAIIEANRESGFAVLNPVLAQHTVLWGLGVTKDVIDTSRTEPVETAEEHTEGFACAQCGYQEPPAETPELASQQASQQCPMCQGPLAQQTADLPGQAGQMPSAKIKTTVPTIFEVYVPRDCGDPNLSPLILEVTRRSCGELKRLYPQIADAIQPDADHKGQGLAQFYLQSLRRLMASGSTPLDEDPERATVIEAWCKWQWLTEEVQTAIAAEWKTQPSQHPMYAQNGMTKLDAAIEYGVYGVFIADRCAEWGENPYEGDPPYTFFSYQKDVASPYPKGLATELVPLQKQLNRVDSLMLKAVMTSGVGKWVKPISQSRTTFTGDPADVIEYDDADGRAKPEFVNAAPYGPALTQMRERIVGEFQQLGYTSSIDRGGDGNNTGPFRALAFLGSKAEESRKTQRFLWEQAHEIRARKLLRLCKLAWDTPRKVKVAGFNNRFGAQYLDAADLSDGEYSIEVIQDSSRPKTVDEKLQTIATLLQGGLANPQDPGVRDYILDTLGENDLDLIDHLSYVKAERDLELVKQGQQPPENPAMNWHVEQLIFSQYMQTEEFEQQPPPIQQAIVMWWGYCQMRLMPPPMAPPPGNPGNPAQKAGKALAPPSASHVLGGVPGKQFGPGMVQTAAAAEGQQVVDALPQEPSTIQ